MELMLISNSYQFGKGYLDHCIKEISEFLGKREITFIPYALNNHKEHTSFVRKRFEEFEINVIGVNEVKTPKKVIQKAESIFIGGGNTFRLINMLYKQNLVLPIRSAVREGSLYLGSSAGANVACPTIKTTNDMPIVYPPSFVALRLVPFQINPHYKDAEPKSKDMGETREDRIKEFHEENTFPVIGLYEGSWLRISKGVVTLGGASGAKVFWKGQKAEKFPPYHTFDLELNSLIE